MRKTGYLNCYQNSLADNVKYFPTDSEFRNKGSFKSEALKIWSGYSYISVWNKCNFPFKISICRWIIGGVSRDSRHKCAGPRNQRGFKKILFTKK